MSAPARAGAESIGAAPVNAEPSVEELPGRIDAALDELCTDPATTAKVEGLVRLLTRFYGEGLARTVAALAGDDEGRSRLVDAAADDELLGDLLVLHDLHPLDAEQRVNAALDAVRPYLGSHAGGVELLGVRDGVAHLALEGSCDGCPASSVTVRNAIEGAVLKAAPEVEEVRVDGEVEPNQGGNGTGGLLQIGRPPKTEYSIEDCPV